MAEEKAYQNLLHICRVPGLGGGSKHFMANLFQRTLNNTILNFVNAFPTMGRITGNAQG